MAAFNGLGLFYYSLIETITLFLSKYRSLSPLTPRLCLLLPRGSSFPGRAPCVRVRRWWVVFPNLLCDRVVSSLACLALFGCVFPLPFLCAFFIA